MFYYGIVEDILDPKQLGRVRVRVFGIHTHDKTAIPTGSLPWASVVQPTTSAANSGIGTTPRLLNGTLVMLTFADGEDLQLPVVVGSLPSELKESILRLNGEDVPRDPDNHGFQDPNGAFPLPGYKKDATDTNRLAKKDTFITHHMYTTRTEQKTNSEGDDLSYTCANPVKMESVVQSKEDAWYQDVSWSELGIANGKYPEYPNNQVRESRAGIVEEWDDTPGQVRTHRYHPSGTFEEIVDDGSRTIKVIGTDYEMYLDGKNVYVNGNLNLTVTGDKRELIQGDYHLEVEGDMTLQVKESYQEKISKNFSTEIGTEKLSGNRTTNISGNDTTLTRENTVETTLQDRYRVVNGKYVSSVTDKAFYTYMDDHTSLVNGGRFSTINKSKMEQIYDSETHIVGTNQTVGIAGWMSTQVTSSIDIDSVAGNITMDSYKSGGYTINLNSGADAATKGAARIGDTADTGEGDHGDGTDKIETGSSSVIIGD